MKGTAKIFDNTTLIYVNPSDATNFANFEEMTTVAYMQYLQLPAEDKKMYTVFAQLEK